MRYFSRDEVERIGRAGSCLWHNPADYCGIAYRYLSSFWLMVEPMDEAFTPHGPDGFWEAWITKWISQELANTDLFVDVGANVGYYTMLAASSGVQTIAVEPNPNLCDYIKIARDLNRFHHVEILNEAFSDSDGEMFLVVPDRHSGGAYVVDEKDIPAGATTYKVDVTSIDHGLVRGYHNRKILFKVDAEGAEPKIWAGMRDYWKRYDCTMILEWDRTRYDAEQFAQSLFDNDKNYLAYVDSDGNEVEQTHWLQLSNLEGLQMVVVRKRER